MFVLISGALLLDPNKDESTGVFARKRCRRLVVPMLFWTVLYYATRARGGAELTLPLILRELLKGRPTDFLWFLFMLPGLYLLTPSLRLYLRSASTSNRAGVVVILLTIAMLHSVVASWQCASRPTVLTMFIPYLGYYVCGYHLRTTSTVSVPVAALSATVIVCTGLIVGVTGLLVPNFGWRKGAFLHDFLSLPVIAMSLAVFMAFSKLRYADSPFLMGVGRWCRAVAPSTLGVYLCHPLILRLAERAERHGQVLTTSGWAAAGIPVVSVLVFLASTAIIMVVLRIPYLRRTVS